MIRRNFWQSLKKFCTRGSEPPYIFENLRWLVIIRIDETEFDNLPPGLRVRTVIDYSKTVERPFWMGRLLQFLQVPEDSDNQDAVTGQEKDTNNGRDSGMGKRRRNSFVRLNSTSSNGIAVFFV